MPPALLAKVLAHSRSQGAMDFATATAAAKALSGVTNEDKLRLYALYKQATVGAAPESSHASMFDLVGQQKYKAWDSVRELSADEAKREYACLVIKLSPPPADAAQQQPTQAPCVALPSAESSLPGRGRLRRDSVTLVLSDVAADPAASAGRGDAACSCEASSSFAGRIAKLDHQMRSFGKQIVGQNTHYHDRSGTTFQIVTLLVSMAVITFCGLIFHLAHPTAAHDRAAEQFDSPPPRPPPLPPAVMQPPSPPPVSEVFEWWQRRRPISEMVTAAWIELALCALLCCILPVGCVYWRRSKVARTRRTTVLQRLGSSRRLRHQKLAEYAPDSPGGRWKSAFGATLVAAESSRGSSIGIEVGTRV
eukprot:CAMPEP_0115834428 /NCGR_PEP_ID=MMETSP0287-20121206/3677_1 /TAXON_ID=412157 /ORGANISM="Chrysochromulina rotalis, Strain UIO044" /LENGTH=363 /DNA_ID=CAMNT_0003287861 /DNA_START=11 /DNA_END=1103 /DNA_ORIENTATION=+